ncbi:MAG: TMEM175 family protein [Gammaproteobacteria bacterium]|nr:TMEM175 family protein [Gammaproteobacteria bacterium]MCY4344813.1 TMEM175 family protein [Gammaproteobacteria bacterium]
MNLNELPIESGFRIRGASMTRVETFADAAFAFAVTLLVISVDDVPSSYDEFQTSLKSVPVFFACLGQMIMFWIGHHKWSRLYGLDDLMSLWLTVFLIAGILVLVYPLRVVMSLGFGMVSGGWVPVSFDVTAAQVSAIFVFYGLAFAFLSGIVLGLHVHAWRRRDLLELNELERFETLKSITLWTSVSAIGLLSSLIAVLNPTDQYGLAGWFYWSLFLAIAWVNWRARKRRRALFQL